VKEPERLVLLEWRGNTISTNWGSGNLLSYPLCRDFQEQDRFFDGVLCRHPTRANLSTGQHPEPASIEVVSGSYFEILGVRAERGRLIDKSDDVVRDGHPVVVVSYDYWRNRLGGAADVVGSKLLVNNHPMTVIGVAPAGFRGVDPAQSIALWIPTMMKRQATPEFDELFNRRAHWMHIFGRLKPGVTAEQAKAGLQPWFHSMLEADTNRADFPRVTAEQRKSFLASTIDVIPAPGGRSDLRNRMREPLQVLLAGTSLLLLLACVNVANLFLARGAARVREVRTRLALGASHGRIASQLLADSMLIALGGGVLGILVSPAVSQALLSFVTDDLRSQVDYRIFLLAFLVCVTTGVVCGLVPAFQAARSPLFGSLKDRAGNATSAGVRLRKALVAGQLAFTLILLIAVGLFVQTLDRLQAKGPGFATSSLLMFRVDPISNGYAESDASRLMRELLRRLDQLAGVEHAALANAHVLTGGSSSTNMTIQAAERIVSDRAVHYMRVSPGFFTTLGIQLMSGRDFDERDRRDSGSTEKGARSAIVSETFARRYFSGRNPIGSHVGLGNRPGVVTNIEIVGVSGGFSRRNLRDDVEQVFFPYWEGNSTGGTFYVKVRGRPQSAFPAIRAAVAELDNSLPVIQPITLDEQIDRSLATERMLATLSSGFGVIALALSVVGLYGVMSFIVTRRTQEIGIRLALGATRSGIVWLMVRDALFMIAAGTAVALPSAWLLRRLVETQLFGVSAVDGPTIAAATGILALVSLGAATLPSWRATLVSPTESLRSE
jgi:predicted permease